MRSEIKKECCNLEKTVDRYGNQLASYIRTRIDCPQDAADVCQTVLLKLVLSHAKNPNISNLQSWIFQLTNNTIADYYRDKKINLVSPEFESHLDTRIEQIESETILQNDYVPLLKILISELEEKYRIPLYLSDIQNYPQKAIAKHLGLSVTAVKSRISRARKQLHALICKCIQIEFDNTGKVISFEPRESCILFNEVQIESAQSLR